MANVPTVPNICARDSLYLVFFNTNVQKIFNSHFECLERKTFKKSISDESCLISKETLNVY